MINLIEEYIELRTNDALDYADHHKDSGDNYAMLVPDSLDLKELSNYLDTQCVDTHNLDIDTIADLVLLHFKMRSAHMFESRALEVHSFTIASFRVEEVEVEVEYSEIERETGVSQVTQALLDEAGYGGYCHDEHSLTVYASSDFLWIAYITIEELEEIIANY